MGSGHCKQNPRAGGLRGTFRLAATLLAGCCVAFSAWSADPAPAPAADSAPPPAAPPATASASSELFAAAAQGRLGKLETLLAQGADANGKTPAGRTPLMLAAANGNAGVVRALLVYGADVNLADARGVTALMDAVTFGRAEVVKLLLDAGAASSEAITAKARQIGDKTIIALLDQAGSKKSESAGKEDKTAGPSGKK